MPKLHIKRFYYRSGQIHTEMRAMGGRFHGLHRTWHRNGKLAAELRYRHGLLHGVSREWDETGRLLGSFTMVHGTGTQRYWHDNGRMRTEISSLNGKFHGRTRGWLRDGTLIKENYLIENQDVTRTAYLQVARKNPDWPQYEGERAGRVFRKGDALERKILNLFVQAVLEKSGQGEARSWLKAETHPKSRSLAKFRTAKAALQFVEKLYATGAEAVSVFAISPGKGKRLFADALLVQLPKSKLKRMALRNICRNFCAKRGGAALPDKEIGETHLYLMLA